MEIASEIRAYRRTKHPFVPSIVCPDDLLPDGAICPRCGGLREPSGVNGGSWVHYNPANARVTEYNHGVLLSSKPLYPTCEPGAVVLGEKGSHLQAEPWPTNFRSCFDYGVKYACPFFAGCDHQDWNLVPVDAVAVDGRLKTLPPDARPWGQEQLSNFSPSGASNELVVLSATSVETWLRCRERYRKHYEVGLDLPSNEAAALGKNFHHALAIHYRSMVKSST